MGLKQVLSLVPVVYLYKKKRAERRVRPSGKNIAFLLQPKLMLKVLGTVDP
jgi:hypothetical protein